MEQVKIVVTASAIADLEEIEYYIALDSPAIARKFINRIFNKIDQLKSYPESGKYIVEIPEHSLRELLFNRYRIIYLFQNSTVSVIRVVHGSRLLDMDHEDIRI